ncbi:Nischarin [Merluccius polli]|uniref:Nischarin n=1 Tax=Merluccius polli TaxID=89951 RepID=A0AA47P1R3_MERPO|nr:Nischarin [Merluccius polli]
MEAAGGADERRRSACILGSELVESYTVYVIQVTDGEHRWTVKHRYSDFHELHEKLGADWLVDKQLLPPKKMLGKNSPGLVERRRRELEAYLQTLLLLPSPTPPPLASFLHFDLYERSGVAASLAKALFHRGEDLLAGGQVFSLRPLQLHSVWEQLHLSTPCGADTHTHLGHILDFTCRLRYLKIQGTQGPIGTSNIHESSLTFDLSIFKSLLHVEVSECSSQQIQGLPSLRRTLVTLSIHNTTSSMTAILAPEASEFPQWEAESAEGAGPGSHVTAVIPLWRKLTTLDLSHNTITEIDASMKLVPEVEFLDLSHNQLQSVDHLQHLYNLVHLDLSYNALQVLQSAHTRLGNIRTLNLAGNRLEQLSGLSKLYSLVNLDLSHNLLAQLQEVRHVAGLPCLERLVLTHNPLCCCPDYRTRTLALFWDRATEVCLDGTATSQQEVDTVEVLKAIQKAKETKVHSSDKRVAEETSLSLLSAAPPAVSSSSSSSPSLRKVYCSSQEVKSREEEVVCPRLICPVASSLLLSQIPPSAVCPSPLLSNQTAPYCSPGGEATDATSSPHPQDTASSPCLSRFSLSSPLLCLSSHLLSLSSNKDFITRLSFCLASLLSQQEGQEEEEEEAGLTSKHKDVLLPPAGCPRSSPTSRDGYFEMGLGGESSPRTPAEEQPRAREVRWCFCVEVEEEEKKEEEETEMEEVEKEVQQKVGCLVFTDQLLGLFSLSADCPWTNHDTDQEVDPCVEDVVSSLQKEFLLPYDKVLFSCSLLPEPWVSLGLRSRSTQLWFIFPSPQDTSLSALIQTKLPVSPEVPPPNTQNPQLLLQSLLSSGEQQEVHGGYPAHLLLPPSGPSPCPTHLLTDILNQEVASSRPPCPSLPHPPTPVNFSALAARERSSTSCCSVAHVPLAARERSCTSCCRLARVPLGAVVLHPRHRADGPQQKHRAGHVVEVVLGGWRLGMVFPLAQDRLSFLQELGARTASLEGLRTVALSELQRLSEENQPPPHLLPSLSAGQVLLAGLSGAELQALFHSSIAQWEGEEVRQVLWLSVIFYSSPETEVTSCLLLSNKAIYFLLEDSASSLSLPSVDQRDQELCLCVCLSISLSDLLSVNVGLFDQYFRLIGGSTCQVVCCVSRDSYGTSCFLKELMSALSLDQTRPDPEPAEQDFYTQFTNTASGKMQNYELVHSSRVRFIYPSEDEMGDLTFIVADRKSPASSSSSFNILLYLLVFQVQVSDLPERSGHGPPDYDSTPSPWLLPRTLVLTASHIFLLDEDYVSYPLPDFAKEPPCRERYQVCEARRIRDVERVLLGYQTYPQALTLVLDELPGPDLLPPLHVDHFSQGEGPRQGGGAQEVTWCIFVPAADSRERLVALLARQWEALCSRELPLELTG